MKKLYIALMLIMNGIQASEKKFSVMLANTTYQPIYYRIDSSELKQLKATPVATPARTALMQMIALQPTQILSIYDMTNEIKKIGQFSSFKENCLIRVDSNYTCAYVPLQ